MRQCLRAQPANASDSPQITGRRSPTSPTREMKVGVFILNSTRFKQIQADNNSFSLESMLTCTAFNSGRAKYAMTVNLLATVQS